MKSQKNDANDAEASCEAVSGPKMRFVPGKSIAQQDLQCMHRVRSRQIGCRTQLVNQVRGLLAEYGIVLPQHIGQLQRHLPALLEDAGNELTSFTRRLFSSLDEELAEVENKIASADARIELQHLLTIEGDFEVTVTGFEIPEIDVILSEATTPGAGPCSAPSALCCV